jgi:hypothetical protein
LSGRVFSFGPVPRVRLEKTPKRIVRKMVGERKKSTHIPPRSPVKDDDVILSSSIRVCTYIFVLLFLVLFPPLNMAKKWSATTKLVHFPPKTPVLRKNKTRKKKQQPTESTSERTRFL